MNNIEEIKGKTPNGGTRVTLMYFDGERNPVDKANASFIEAVEYDNFDKVVGRTYLAKPAVADDGSSRTNDSGEPESTNDE